MTKFTTLFENRYLPWARRHLKAKTLAEYERLTRREILPRLGERFIEQITLDDAEELHTAVPGKVQANRAISYLSAVLTFAVERRLLALHPFRGLIRRNREKGREFFYSPAQTRALLDAAARCLDIRAKYIALELLTGTRPGELIESGPNWRHGAVLQLPDDKTGGGSVFLSPRACAILDSLEAVGGKYFPDLTLGSLRRPWERLCRDAGVPRARMYDLRHTFASAALAAGHNLDAVGQAMRHRKVQTTRRYAHLAPDVGVKIAAAAAERMFAATVPFATPQIPEGSK
jgi:integrase